MIRRHIEAALTKALADTPVVLVNGARQTGKTTLTRSLAQKSGTRYVTLDDAVVLSAVTADPLGFIRNLDGPVVIDEIQKAPELFPAIKLAVDQNRQPGRFLLTGSANVLTLPRLSESLVGRMEIVPLFPLSAGELAGQSEGFLTRLFTGAVGQLKLPPNPERITHRLVQGGYPETVQRTTEERRAAWFGSYLSTILQRDVRDLARVDALQALPNLLQLLAARSSGLLNLADVGRDAALPHTSLTRYLALLESVFLVQRLPAWSRNLGQRLVKAPKLHLIDTGLACHLLGANTERLEADRNLLGRILESFVAGELAKQLSWTAPQTKLCHFRTAIGSEIDFLLEDSRGAIAGIEVKASASVGASDFAPLRNLQSQLGSQFQFGVVLYLGDQVIPFGDRLWLLPIQALWAE